MSSTKTPTSSLSGSSHLHHLTFNLLNRNDSDQAARHANLVPRPIENLDDVGRGWFSEGFDGTFVPGHQASPGDRRSHHRPSYLRQAQSPRMLPDLLLLVHRRRSSSPPYPYHPNHHVGEKKVCVAPTSPVHAQSWFASLSQEAPDLRRHP